MSQFPEDPLESSYQPHPSDQNSVASPRGDASKDWAAITALVLGCINVLSWCLPLCGFPLNIGGIIFGVIGLGSTKRGMALAGLIMSSISIVLTLINAIVGVVMMMNQ